MGQSEKLSGARQVQPVRFEPENPLERALVRAMQDAAARPEFYRLLMASNLFVVGEVGRPLPPDGPAELQTDDMMKLAFVEREGRKYHPVFSALSRLRSFTPPDKQHFCLLGRDLFLTTAGAQFVLNPGCDFGKELGPDEIGYWLSQFAGQRSASAAKRTVAVPQKRPAVLLKALGVLFVKRQVRSARLVEVRDGKTKLVLAVETDADWRRLRREISAAAHLAAPKFDFELLQLNRGDRRDAFTRQIFAVPPFYVRKQFQEQKEPAS
jgi:hypothetical protein